MSIRYDLAKSNPYSGLLENMNSLAATFGDIWDNDQIFDNTTPNSSTYGSSSSNLTGSNTSTDLAGNVSGSMDTSQTTPAMEELIKSKADDIFGTSTARETVGYDTPMEDLADPNDPFSGPGGDLFDHSDPYDGGGDYPYDYPYEYPYGEGGDWWNINFNPWFQWNFPWFNPWFNFPGGYGYPYEYPYLPEYYRQQEPFSYPKHPIPGQEMQPWNYPDWWHDRGAGKVDWQIPAPEYNWDYDPPELPGPYGIYSTTSGAGALPGEFLHEALGVAAEDEDMYGSGVGDLVRSLLDGPPITG